MISSFPEGANLSSLYEASVTMGRIASVNSGVRAVLGDTSRTAHLLLGYRANDFCRIILDHAIEPNALLQKHTLFPIFSNLLKYETTEGVDSDLISGNRPFNSIRYLGTFKYKSYVSSKVRFCITCVGEDLKEHGFAYQRLIHQLTSERRCLYHGVELFEGCSCTAETRKWVGIVSACPSCRRAASPISSSTPIKNSYALYVLNDILRRVLTHNAPELLIRQKGISLRALMNEHIAPFQLIPQKFLDWIQIKDSSAFVDAFDLVDSNTDLDVVIFNGRSRSLKLDLAMLAFAWEHLPKHTRKQIISL